MAKEASLRALSLWTLIVAFGVVVVAVDVKLRSDRTKAYNQHNVRYWRELYRMGQLGKVLVVCTVRSMSTARGINPSPCSNNALRSLISVYGLEINIIMRLCSAFSPFLYSDGALRAYSPIQPSLEEVEMQLQQQQQDKGQ